MHRRHAKKASKTAIRLVFLFTALPLFSLCVTFVLLYVLVPLNTTPTDRSVEDSTYETPVGITVKPPKRLIISSLNIDAVIKPVGLNIEGDMDIDDNIGEVAWYYLGPKPGEEGSSVIAGHYGWKQGVAAVFNEIHTLKVGDRVTVYGADNEAKNFIVRLIRSYHKDEDATEVFKSYDGKAHLNLITCEGEWNNSLMTYSERLVVFTDQE